MAKINKLMLCLSAFVILLQTGCTGENTPQVSSVSSGSSASYYSVEEKSVDTGLPLGISPKSCASAAQLTLATGNAFFNNVNEKNGSKAIMMAAILICFINRFFS